MCFSQQIFATGTIVDQTMLQAENFSSGSKVYPVLMLGCLNSVLRSFEESRLVKMVDITNGKPCEDRYLQKFLTKEELKKQLGKPVGLLDYKATNRLQDHKATRLKD